MDWNVVAQYLPLFEKAAWLTLRLGLAGIALAIVIGLVCALVQYYKVPVLRRVVEVLKVAQQIIEANRMASPNAAFGIYLVVFLLYFLACWPISLLASYLEKKWR